MVQLQLLLSHPLDQQSSIEHAELLLQRLLVHLTEPMLVDVLRVLLPALIPPPDEGGTGLTTIYSHETIESTWSALLSNLEPPCFDDAADVFNEDDFDKVPMYMRLLHVGAAHLNVRYLAGKGELTRTVFALLAAQQDGPGGTRREQALAATLRNVVPFMTSLATLDDARLKFTELVLTDVFASVPKIGEAVQRHYLRQVTRQVYKVVGAANIIGNPLALLDSLAGGVVEFIIQPAQGFLSDGFGGLGVGVQRGTQALVQGVVGGGLTSISRITGSLSNALIGLTGSRTPAKGDPQQSTLEQLKENLEGVIVKPYRWAVTGGVKGFGKGLVAGIVSVVLTPAALALGAVSIASNVGAQQVRDGAHRWAFQTRWLRGYSAPLP